jgi:hypothetical protein
VFECGRELLDEQHLHIAGADCAPEADFTGRRASPLARRIFGSVALGHAARLNCAGRREAGDLLLDETLARNELIGASGSERSRS